MIHPSQRCGGCWKETETKGTANDITEGTPSSKNRKKKLPGKPKADGQHEDDGSDKVPEEDKDKEDDDIYYYEGQEDDEEEGGEEDGQEAVVRE